jgi:hypothetical protein
METVEHYPANKLLGRMALHRPVKHLCILGMKPDAQLREFHAIEGLLRSNCKVLLLFVAPQGQASKLISRFRDGFRKEASGEWDQLAAKINELRNRWNGKTSVDSLLHVRTIDWIPSSCIVLMDPTVAENEAGGIGWVGVYTPDFSSSAQEKWFIELPPGSASLAHYRKQYRQLWDQAKPVNFKWYTLRKWGRWAQSVGGMLMYIVGGVGAVASIAAWYHILSGQP